jgi:hypothetical protein
MRGEIDLAFEALETAHRIKDSGLPLTKVLPLLRNLHADPRWPVFLRKIGWPDQAGACILPWVALGPTRHDYDRHYRSSL